MLFSAVCVSADFEITEIMYDLEGTDTNREWIEVKNIGEQTIDFSKWFLFTDNTKHTLVPQGETNIIKGEYAVVVQNVLQFKKDWPNYQGLIFDSSWTGLKNSGEVISLKDPDLNIESPINFSSNQGGAGDGYSIQKINGNWVGSKPTPGKENVFTKKIIAPIITSTTGKLAEEQTKIEDKNEVDSADIIEKVDKQEVINLNDIKDSGIKNNKLISFYPYIGLIVVIGIGITIFLIFIKREKEEQGIEKKLTAKDIKIIE